ncbi:hypothetical protein POKO110462_18480 [Pontibacter korlensis]|uniref:hypothetical protein n=1 Tax=Pontibacter korlensis TaxID=400092 RepID=UPI0006962949|nr:hypothetical protein [Pontibacter korlensis]
MYKLKNILLATFLPLLFAACNGGENGTATENEQALADYRDYVTSFERDSLSETELRALQQSENDSAAWATERANLQEEYNMRREPVTANIDNYSAEQRAEAEDLDQRYNTALEAREQQFNDASRRYKLRRELLGLKIQEDDMSGVTAANIGETYQRYVSTLEENAANYDSRDWQLIEGWWSALNSRYRTLEGELQASVKKTVQQAQAQYQKIRQEHTTDAEA